MARLSSVTGPAGPDPTAINLSRMLYRLQQILINPDAATESKLRISSYEREKVGTVRIFHSSPPASILTIQSIQNIEYARTLLLRLEQDALQIKIQNKKQEAQADLVRKRDALDRLSERLSDLNQLGDFEFDSEGSSEGEDLLGEDTPGEGDETSTDDQNDLTPPPTASSIAQSTESLDHVARSNLDLYRDPEKKQDEAVVKSSTLRARNLRNDRAELFAPTTSTAQSTSISHTTETLLTHNRTEQETLTNSLLSMARQLKASSSAFASSLEEEKTILARATEGLDRNELGMEAAQKRMGYLRSMTEGKGWLGRMLMYAWIAGLAVLALVIVFVLPKLRF